LSETFSKSFKKTLILSEKKTGKINSAFSVLKIKQICQKTEMEEATSMIVKNTNFSKRFLVSFLGF